MKIIEDRSKLPLARVWIHRMKKVRVCSAWFGLFAVFSGAVSAQGIVDQWQAENGKTRIKISECGRTLCAEITWLQKNRKDANNKNPALRDRDLVGVQVASDMRPVGDNKWSGLVYSAKRGTTFKSTVKLSGDVLAIKGCLTAASFICKTVKYNRYN